ncbi:Dabb family protein [Martelella sp. HB161492]|uniref:Dabb family protein n=1 Tax=Martelella sp. HB161492 TaxID=2720726 RepID=UPI0015929442|nr:Dabb family protein [Martelella sp. HB161492]
MILHCVFIRFRPEIDRTAKADIYHEIEMLGPLVPGMVEVKAGENVSPEGLHCGYDDGFIVTFEDAAARDAYLVHPAHKEVGAKIVAAAVGGTAGLLVFDLKA